MAYFPCNMAQTNGTATSSQILKDYTAWVNGYKITGSMVNNGAVSKTITPTTSDQAYTVPQGYHNGSGSVTVKGVSISTPTAAQILSGTSVSVTSNGSTLSSVAGTMANYDWKTVTATSLTASSPNDDTYTTFKVPQAGYYGTTDLKIANSALIAVNSNLSGASCFITNYAVCNGEAATRSFDQNYTMPRSGTYKIVLEGINFNASSASGTCYLNGNYLLALTPDGNFSYTTQTVSVSKGDIIRCTGSTYAPVNTRAIINCYGSYVD